MRHVPWSEQLESEASASSGRGDGDFSLLQIARVWTCVGRGPVDAGRHFFSPGEGLGAPRALASCPHTELSSGLCLLFRVLAPIKRRFLASLFLG